MTHEMVLSRKRLSEASLMSDCSSVNSASSQSKRLRPESGGDHSAATRRGPWSAEEDELLTTLVNKFGTKKWAHIADRIPGRVGKQCRERWLNHLRNDVKKTIWTEEEDRILLAAQQELGNRWSAIAKLLPGRPENSVKNRFNSLSHRMRRWEDDLPAGAHPSAHFPLGSNGDHLDHPSYHHESERKPSINRRNSEFFETKPIMVGANNGMYPNLIPYSPPNMMNEMQANAMYAYKNGVYAPWNMIPVQQPASRSSEVEKNFPKQQPMTKETQRCLAWSGTPSSESYSSSSTTSSPMQASNGSSGSQANGLLLLATLCT
jgi:hypothetical protein